MWPVILLLLYGVRFSPAEYIPPGPAFQCPANQFSIYPCNCTSGGERGLQIECENTNLASLSVGLINVGNLDTRVEKLLITRCNIGEQIFLFYIIVGF